MQLTRRPTPSILGVFATLVALSAATATAAPMAESGLRSSRALSAAPAASELERSLLRAEHRSGQSRMAENEILADMMARMARMGKTIGELHRLVDAMPAEPCRPTEAPTCPAIAGTEGNAEGEWPWLAMAAIAGAALLLGLMLRRRGDDNSPGAAETILVATETPAITEEPPPTVMEPPVTRPGRRPRKPPAVAEHLPTSPVDEEAWPASMPPAVDDAITDADLSLELADVMVSMGLAGGAAQTLEGHIRQHPRQALFHWLKLLEVYRRFGQREEFEKAAHELQHHFNIAPPPWQSSQAAKVAPSLANYPHICSRLQELWPRRSCVQYLQRLLEDNRGGTRGGFPQPVVEEILLLLDMLRD